MVIYSKPDCVQCNATYRKANELGLEYTSIDITEDEEARQFVLGLGFQQAPVVVVGEQSWSGYKPHNLQALAA